MLKVIETHERLDEYAECYSIEIKRDEKALAEMSASDRLSERPEDATLGRNLSYIFAASDFISIAYEAGKAGEEIQFVTKYLNEDEKEITEEEYNKK